MFFVESPGDGLKVSSRGKGSSKFKNITNIFLQKVHIENFHQKIDKISMSVFLNFFGFIVLPGVYRRWEFKSTTKNVLQKGRVEKFLPKN
jgi:UDP-N-acetylglucosamine:LPS N-acetylglucosamine transferase